MHREITWFFRLSGQSDQADNQQDVDQQQDDDAESYGLGEGVFHGFTKYDLRILKMVYDRATAGILYLPRGACQESGVNSQNAGTIRTLSPLLVDEISLYLHAGIISPCEAGFH